MRIASDSARNTTIAFTGADLPVPLIADGGVMVGIGIFLVVALRRRHTPVDDDD